MTSCKYCYGPHPWWECHKKPEGWRPAVKEPRLPVATVVTSPGGVTGVVHGDKPLTPETEAAIGRVIDAAAAAMDKRPPGRPRIHPDRKAYKAQKERERRAKAKEPK